MTDKAKQIFNFPNAARALIAALVAVNAWFLDRFTKAVDAMAADIQAGKVQLAVQSRDLDDHRRGIALLEERLREVEKKL